MSTNGKLTLQRAIAVTRSRVQANVQSCFVRLENVSFVHTMTNDELGNWDVLRAFFFTLEMGICVR